MMHMYCKIKEDARDRLLAYPTAPALCLIANRTDDVRTIGPRFARVKPSRYVVEHFGRGIFNSGVVLRVIYVERASGLVDVWIDARCEVVQRCFPRRIKAVYIVNQGLPCKR